MENNIIILGEAIQIILRREGIKNGYELIKSLTRTNEIITKDEINDFIEKLNISEKIKKEISNLCVYTYTGKFL